jgi:hypothetical protein
MLLEKDNANEVQRHWENEFGTPPSTCVKVAFLHAMFGADGTMQNVDKEPSEDLAF